MQTSPRHASLFWLLGGSLAALTFAPGPFRRAAQINPRHMPPTTRFFRLPLARHEAVSAARRDPLTGPVLKRPIHKPGILDDDDFLRNAR